MLSELPARLVEWRTTYGISLATVAAATKISPRYLDAIERGKFRSLPGGVYGLNYVRQYAQAIHYREDELLAYYRSMMTPEDAGTPAQPARATWATRLRVGLRSLFSIR